MSVDLEFQQSVREASVASATDPAALFEETVLIVPIRFRVNGRDMLPIKTTSTTVWSVDPNGTASDKSIEVDSWKTQPLVGFLVRIRRAIAETKRSGQSRCYLIDDADLTFKLHGQSELEVTSPRATVTAVAPIDEFTDAIDGFEKDVRAWLEESAPQLVGHPWWAEWFPAPDR